MGQLSEEKQNEQIEQACQAAREFSKLYYETMDKKRHLLNKLYEDKAQTIWNGNQVTGKEAVQKFYEELPTSEHKLDSLDSQPLSEEISAGQFTILVKTYGTVKFPSSNLKSFHQSFLLTSVNNVWKIISDTFRFQDKSDE